jgi:two-component system, NarL family, response regulator LiaR
MLGAAVDAHPTPQEVSELARDEPVRVVIADLDGLARSMMQTAMRNAGGIAIIATTGSAREMLELVSYYRPAVLIVETALLRDGGLKLLGSVRAASPATCVLTISVDDDQTALEALRAGAVGHLSKDIDPRKLASLVARAADGEAIVPRRLVRPLLARLPEPPDARWRPLHSRLTTREWEIIALLDEGASNQDIADRLILSAATVKSHVKNVLRKLDVHSRRDAVAAAHQLRRIEAMGDKAPQLGPESSPASPTADGKASEQRDTPAAAQPRLRIASTRAGDWR